MTVEYHTPHASGSASSSKSSLLLHGFSSLAKSTCSDTLEDEEERESWSPEASPDSAYDSDASTSDEPFTNPSKSLPDMSSVSLHTTPPPAPKAKSALNLASTASSAPYSRGGVLPQKRLTRLSPLTPSEANLPSPPKMALGCQTQQVHLPKSQPLARALFARMANDAPHAGSFTKKKSGGAGQKLIVPTKSFRTTFELGLTASELARKA